MLVEGFASGALAANCWVVSPAAESDCVVIDPGMDSAGPLHDLLARHRLRPVAILLTHGHFDHSQGAATLGLPTYVHPADRGQLTDPWSPVGLPAGTPIAGETDFREPARVHDLRTGPLRLAGLTIDVAEVPGHTPGSVVLAVDGHLFTGDFLFAGTIGRVDFPGGDEVAMRASLRTEFARRDDADVVHPGHGDSTTVGAERAGNPYVAWALGT